MPVDDRERDRRGGSSLLRADLIKKGIRNPEQIPPFVLGEVFPNSRWAPDWRRENGYITFEDGEFAGGNPTRSELSARIYHEVEQVRELLPTEEYERSLEIGCGYGRLSGWIAEHADEAVAVEPNADAIGEARILYPDVDFVETVAEELPFPDESFDLVVSWAVLQHVPPDSIERAAEEVKRILTDDGTLLLCERTGGEPGRVSWPRSKADYESLFAPYDLVANANRGAEPTFDYAELTETMVFVADGTRHASPRTAE